jgi:hypothetical protein
MMMDSYVTNSAVSTSIASSDDQLGDDLIRLAGAMLVTAVEVKHGQCFAETKIKFFIGDDMISAKPPQADA